MAINDENILVDFDYQNIIIIDPNRIVDNEGNVKERLVKHENMVMYANLECKVLPRTKLLLGAVPHNNDLQTVSVAKINFLNPGDKKFYDNSYLDEFTGKGTLKGQGVNQANQYAVKDPKNSDQFYLNQTFTSNGQNQVVDSGLLGIKSINVSTELSLKTQVTISLIDVRGRALFELADNSPYGVFFQYPYPPFTLTIKGYYGKAVQYKLQLTDFKSSFDADSGNFEIELKFDPYIFSVLNEIKLSDCLALPHMYEANTVVTSTPGQVTDVNEGQTAKLTKGYQKIREVFKEYKNKKLVDENLPEYTVYQFKEKLKTFITDILNSYQNQESLSALTNCEVFLNDITSYKDKIYRNDDSWLKTNLYEPNSLFLSSYTSDNSIKYIKNIPFKKEIQTDIKKRETAINNLKGIIDEYNKKLGNNPTFGASGSSKSYTIANVKTDSVIPVDIKFEDFYFDKIDSKLVAADPIDYQKSYQLRYNATPSGDTDPILVEFKNNVKTTELPTNDYFIFEGISQGNKSFLEKISDLETALKTKKTEIESALTESLKETLELNLGFKPTINNMVGIILANAEAFLRLMDDVHKSAWNKRDDPTRRRVILESVSNSASVDRPKISRATSPVYPWPQFIVEDTSNPTKTSYQVKYPGDYPTETGSNDYTIWPEVEFVEEYLNGFILRNTPANFVITQNQTQNLPFTSLNTVEYPLTYTIYSSLEDVKFIYEIYERVITYAFYSKLNRFGSRDNSVYKVLIDMEAQNIKNALKTDNPFLIQILKNYNFNAKNFELILRHISNDGAGESWQNFSRGIYNTPYLQSVTETPYYISSFDPIKQDLIGTSENVINFLESTKNNGFDQTDIYPYVNEDWVNESLADSATISGDTNLAFNTTKTIFYNTKIVQTANFTDASDSFFVRPFTYFYQTNVNDPSIEITNKETLKAYYEDKSKNFDKQHITEGNINYIEYDNQLIGEQTTSMLNTPYFVNSIIKGVQNFREFNQYPFREAAYLFLNSLPLTTLREKYKTYSNTVSTDLDYMFATFKKFGSVHKLPYAWVLKYGSIWNRYKSWVETGFDYMTIPWDNFNYAENYDPITQDISKVYTLSGFTNITTDPVDISLQRDIVSGFLTGTQMNLGFYPKLVDDFNLFFNGLTIFDTYTDSEIQEQIDNGKLYINLSESSLLNYDFGFDPSDQNRAMNISTLSTLVKDDKSEDYFITPSFGSSFNQTKYECFKGPDGQQKLKTEVKDNPAVFNGSVRAFWSLPNYGYFDNNRLAINSPNEYLKTVLKTSKNQENFSINGDTNGNVNFGPFVLSTRDIYTSIEEVFSVFERQVLDLFEEHFLNFSKSKYDYTNILKTPETNPASEDDILIKYRNFQLLATELFRIPGEDFINESVSDEALSKIKLTQLDNVYSLLNKFMNYDIMFNNGNPSFYNKKTFYSLSSSPLVDKLNPVSYNLSTPYALPYLGGTTTLAQSQNFYSDEWRALETYVGYSSIPNLVYTDNGSFITDFFIDLDIAFTVDNIKDFAPLVKIYATQKLEDNTLDEFKFRQILTNIIETNNLFKDDIINTLMEEVLKNLPNTVITPQPKKANYTGDIGRIEIWEKLKAMNDKWISGNDYKEFTLFEDFLFLDRASRNISSEVYCDVILWKDKLENSVLNTPDRQLGLILRELIQSSGFNIEEHAGYVNYYDVNDVTVRPNPSNQGSTSVANDLFGTFLNVDYRKSKTKMVCTFANEASKNLDIPNSDFRNDVFQLNRQSENPLVEDQSKKQDWGKSNKLVAFNLDIGRQNQGIFTSFSVNMNSGQKTAEEIRLANYTANQGGGINATPQSQSMYNFYKYRVYTCDVTMIGNALMQPKMYFNLRNVPLFSGPYQITKVSHRINAGTFSTSFSGTRQPVYEISTQDSYLQTIYKNFVTPLLTKAKTETEANISTNIIGEQSTKMNEVNGPNTPGPDSCSQDLASPFRALSYSASTATSGLSDTQIATDIKTTVNLLPTSSTLTQNQKVTLRYLTFLVGYISNYDGTTFKINASNFGNLQLNVSYSADSDKFIMDKTKHHFCQNMGGKQNVPVGYFTDVKDPMYVIANRFIALVRSGGDNILSNLTTNDLLNPSTVLIDYLAKTYITQWPNLVNDNVYSQLQPLDKTNLIKEVENCLSLAKTINLSS
jgi:hypothetical protein